MSSTALITGASAGIGRATAIAFANAGYDLIITCKTRIGALKVLAADLENDCGVHVIPVQADVGEYEDVSRLFASVDKLNVLVNNAGISYVGLLSDMSPKEWDQVMKTNLYSCFYTCRLAIPIMLKTHNGRIINVSSVWGEHGASMEVAYSASKGGVNAFTKALARELAPSNIQVNALSCGMIDTDMNARLTDEEMSALIDQIPADRIGTPDEAANLILQIAQSPTYLNGQIITMDGAWT